MFPHLRSKAVKTALLKTKQWQQKFIIKVRIQISTEKNPTSLPQETLLLLAN